MAGRNVGSIEVTVDANTGKMRAQLLRDAKENGWELDANGDIVKEGRPVKG